MNCTEPSIETTRPVLARHQRLAARESGFTLPELLVVIAIIGLLASLLIANMLQTRDRAYDTDAMSCNRTIITAQFAERAEGRPFQALLTDLDQGMVAVCANVEVAEVGPGGPNVTGTGKMTVTAGGENVSFVTWSKRGSTLYVTDTAANKQVAAEARF